MLRRHFSRRVFLSRFASIQPAAILRRVALSRAEARQISLRRIEAADTNISAAASADFHTAAS